MKRPDSFESFRGQRSVIANLKVSARSVLRRSGQMGHTLLVGPAGLGKTTLATSVLPTELGIEEVTTINCAAVERAADLASTLADIADGGILFLDEIHALIPPAREHLLSALEDGQINMTIGEGPSARVISVELAEFSIFAATTRQGVLDAPLRSRFQHTFTLEPYDAEEMRGVIAWVVDAAEFEIRDDAVTPLIEPIHGVARRAVNLINDCIDTFYSYDSWTEESEKVIERKTVVDTLERLGYDNGLDKNELRYLAYLSKLGTAGLKTIAAALDETPATIEEVYEPWLLRQGYIERTSTGRKLRKV